MPDAPQTVQVRAQRRWRLAGPDGKTVAEGFTSVAKAEQWADEHGLEVTKLKDK
jgi:hypothetical protein